MRVVLDGTLAVRSGHTTTHQLLLTNLSARVISVNTNGNLTAAIVDPDTGAKIGGYAGAQHMPTGGLHG